MSENGKPLDPALVDEIRATVDAGRQTVADSAGQSGSGNPPEKKIDFKQLSQDLHDNYQGDARRYVERFKGKLLYDNSDEQWYRHKGSRWVVDKKRNHLKCVAELAPDYEHQATYWQKQAAESKQQGAPKEETKKITERAKQYSSRASRLKDPSHMKKVLTLAGAGNGSLGISGDEWNKHPNLFACKNCILDMETGKSHKPDPNLHINQASDVEWSGLNKESQEWDAFLAQIFLGDEELIDYVQKAVGYWMTGMTNVQEYWSFFGPMGRNGKGVFCRTIRAIMGDYYSAIPAAMITESKMTAGTGPSPELVDLRFARLGVVSEIPKRAKIAEAALKTLTGGDDIKVRSLYSNNMLDFIPIVKIVLVHNHTLQFDGGDSALKARTNIIPLNAHFTDDKSKLSDENHVYLIDRNLEYKLQNPAILSEILSWAARGSVKYYRYGLSDKPTSMVKKTREELDEADTIGEFIQTCLVVTAGQDKYSRTQASPIYDAFFNWCKTEKRMSERYIKSLAAFGSEFKNRPEIRIVPPKNVRTYNVTIKPEWIPADTSA